MNEGMKQPAIVIPVLTRFLSVDPSIVSGHTGWVAWRRGWHWQAEAAGTLSYSKNIRGDARLDMINKAAREIISAYKPQLIVIEDQFLARAGQFSNVSPRSILKLKEAMLCWRFLDTSVEKVAGEVWERHCGILKATCEQQRKLYFNAVVADRLRTFDPEDKLRLRTEHEKSAFMIGAWKIETGLK